MPRFLILSMSVGVGIVVFDGVPSTAEAGGGQDVVECATMNGDVNADDTVSISDAVSILGNLFLGEPPELAPLCEIQGSPSLPATGQLNSVGDCAGQDGFYTTGCPPEGRFVDNGDGTVTDTCTELMWQQGIGNGGNTLNWCEALAYCEGLELAGHDDWRLPNVRELLSIVDYGRFAPAIDPVFDALSFFYWSSTSNIGRFGGVVSVGFQNGGVFSRNKDDSIHEVRAVRSAVVECTTISGDVNADDTLSISDAVSILDHLFLGEAPELAPLCARVSPGLPDTGQLDSFGDCAGQDGSYATGCPPEGRFVDHGDGTVTDTCTGLMWQQDTGNRRRILNWCEALAYCEDLEFAGHDDWRLPNVLELQSIVDYGRSDPSIDPVFRALSFYYWSSTTFRIDSTRHARVVVFENGMVFGSTKADRGETRVRAVRSGP